MKLSAYLDWKNIKREELARKIRTTTVTIGRIINETRRPSPEMARRIEAATDGHVNRLELLYPDEFFGKTNTKGRKRSAA